METELTFCMDPMPICAFEGLMDDFSILTVVPGGPESRYLTKIRDLFSKLASEGEGGTPSLWIESEKDAYGDDKWFQVVCPETPVGRRLIVSDKQWTTVFVYEEEEYVPRYDPFHSERISQFLKDLYAYLGRLVRIVLSSPEEYNDYVETRLPYDFRYGTVSRRDLYEACPERRIRVSGEQAALLARLSDTDGFSGMGADSEKKLPAAKIKHIVKSVPFFETPEPVRFRKPDGTWWIRIPLEGEYDIEPALRMAEEFEKERIPFLFSHIDETMDVLSGKGRIRVVPGQVFSTFEYPEMPLPVAFDEESARNREALIRRIEWEPCPRIRIRE
jgi:hypothetical protein